MIKTVGSLLVLFLGCAALASAGPVVWTLQNVNFSDGGQASGSFTYDVDTNTYSSISVVTTAGSSFPGHAYTFLNSGVISVSSVLYMLTSNSTADNSPFLSLGFVSPLTDLGGTVALDTFSSGESFCVSNCAGTQGAARFYTTGSVTAASATPEPSTVLLLGAGMALLPLLRRRTARS